MHHKSFRAVLTVLGALLLGAPAAALAHAVVSPAAVPPSRYQNFSLSVPTERDFPTVGIRLLVPEKLERITPFVKPGWSIEVLRDADGERIAEIRWVGGSIPPGQKDVFEFTARTPAEPTTLVWKAYQTYRDGVVVPWDQDPHPAGHEEGEGVEKVANPYSVTDVVADTLTAPSPREEKWATPLALLAVVLSLAATGLALRRR